MALLEIRDLTVVYDGVPTVKGVSFGLRRGEVLALIGASGSGKSTIARAIMGMTPIGSGTILLDGERLADRSQARSPEARRRIGMVFQDSKAAFNPRFNVGRIIEEPLLLSGAGNARERQDVVASMLKDVGLTADHASRYPNELSGGQRQRVGIARALACNPDVLICDEAVSALDISIQAQILNLLVDLQRQRGIAILFITHDPDVVGYLADSVISLRDGVMEHNNHMGIEAESGAPAGYDRLGDEHEIGQAIHQRTWWA
ncbi:ABC transporter ATP-binding protein [Tardiphaga sp. 804_B3_N1_9]|uniref:ABC transporter ATP-binding protein n=1 Tax=Tardiphaga sp. 804_B3_N1_9 TaxID=3240786 RepID=UPI003F24E824